MLSPYTMKISIFGSFILIDKVTKNTLGAGTIIEALNNKARIPQQHISTIKKERALIKKQKPFVLFGLLEFQVQERQL